MPDAGVGDFHFHRAIVRAGAHFEHAAAGHGVARVHEQIQKHLLQTRRRAEHGRQLLRVVLDARSPARS